MHAGAAKQDARRRRRARRTHLQKLLAGERLRDPKYLVQSADIRLQQLLQRPERRALACFFAHNVGRFFGSEQVLSPLR